jgi:N6-adenosine-specific RNA methylase IME4
MKYQLIYADPPWDYGVAGQNPTIGGGAKSHYPTMKLKDICELAVPDIADQNAILFLWVTSPMVTKSFQVINAWGFEYKTNVIWDKVKHNMGHYTSVRHELLFIGIRGSIDIPSMWASGVHSEPRTVHSKKPDWFRDRIAESFPNFSKVELFARQKTAGWDVWGNEVESDIRLGTRAA